MPTPFVYQGQGYQIADDGTILAAGGSQVPAALLGDPAFQAAGVAAQSTGSTTLTAPTAAPDATASAAPAAPAAVAPRAGVTSDFSVHQTGSTSTVPPPPGPVLPTTAPRSGIGSDVTNRAALAPLQATINTLQAKASTPDGLSNSESALLGSLTTRATSLSEAISKNESKPATNIVSGTASPSDRYIVREDPANPGKFLRDDNPGFDPAAAPGARKPETHIVGNNAVTIGADGSMTSTVVNAQGDARDNLQAQAQSTSAAASKLNAEANAFAAQSKATIDGMVARGEDAASVRADLQRQSEEIHARATEAIAAATQAQQALDSANAEKHATTRDTQAADAATQLAKDNAQRSTDTRYGYDTSAAASRYTSDNAAKSSAYSADKSAQSAAYTAKLSAATNLYQNSLSALAEINKALPPGSSLAGEALAGMLAYGTKFLNGFAGGGGTDPSQTSGVDPNKDPVVPQPAPGAPAIDPNANPSPWQRADAGQTAPDPTTGLAPPGAAGTVLPGAPNYLGLPAAPTTPSFMLGAGPGAVNTGVAPPSPVAFTPPPPDQFATASVSDPSRALQASNDAAHQANMAAPVSLHPDGSPIATPNDVQRLFGRRGGT